MNIQFTARHFHASPELQTRMDEELRKLSRFHDRITEASIILDSEKKNVRSAEIIVKIVEKTISAHAEEENMGKAIDVAFSRIERQLKKENEKIKEHKAQPIHTLMS
jgi:putative sigma-54 modulation protein